MLDLGRVGRRHRSGSRCWPEDAGARPPVTRSPGGALSIGVVPDRGRRRAWPTSRRRAPAAAGAPPSPRCDWQMSRPCRRRTPATEPPPTRVWRRLEVAGDTTARATSTGRRAAAAPGGHPRRRRVRPRRSRRARRRRPAAAPRGRRRWRRASSCWLRASARTAARPARWTWIGANAAEVEQARTRARRVPRHRQREPGQRYRLVHPSVLGDVWCSRSRSRRRAMGALDAGRRLPGQRASTTGTSCSTGGGDGPVRRRRAGAARRRSVSGSARGSTATAAGAAGNVAPEGDLQGRRSDRRQGRQPAAARRRGRRDRWPRRSNGSPASCAVTTARSPRPTSASWPWRRRAPAIGRAEMPAAVPSRRRRTRGAGRRSPWSCGRARTGGTPTRRCRTARTLAAVCRVPGRAPARHHRAVRRAADLPRDRGRASGIASSPGTASRRVRRWVEQVLRQYLAPLPPYGPEGAGWPLGRRVHGPELEAAALQVEGVEYLEGLRLCGRGWRRLGGAGAADAGPRDLRGGAAGRGERGAREPRQCRAGASPPPPGRPRRAGARPSGGLLMGGRADVRRPAVAARLWSGAMGCGAPRSHGRRRRWRGRPGLGAAAAAGTWARRRDHGCSVGGMAVDRHCRVYVVTTSPAGGNVERVLLGDARWGVDYADVPDGLLLFDPPHRAGAGSDSDTGFRPSGPGLSDPALVDPSASPSIPTIGCSSPSAEGAASTSSICGVDVLHASCRRGRPRAPARRRRSRRRRPDGLGRGPATQWTAAADRSNRTGRGRPAAGPRGRAPSASPSSTDCRCCSPRPSRRRLAHRLRSPGGRARRSST